MSERENRDAARSLSVVHYMDRDLQAVAALTAGLVERSGSGEGTPTVLAILPTADEALGLSERVLSLRGDAAEALTPVTSLTRGRRIVASQTRAIAAAPVTLSRLLTESRLELANVQTLLLVWPEAVVGDDEQRAHLESVVSEVSRTAVRVAFCAERTPELAQFVERSMWRAREVDHRATPAIARSTASLRAITASTPDRPRAVRSILDAFDPVSAALITFTDVSEGNARETAKLLGPSVQVIRGVPEQRVPLAILYDVPDAGALTALASTVDELIAVVPPSHLSALQKVAATVTPMSWTGALANARLTMDALREEIRGSVGSGGHASWIPVLEPLLDGLDPVEVAAAALALLDRERRKARRLAQSVVGPTPPVDRPAREERPGFGQRPPRRDEDRGARRGDDRGPRRGDERGPRRSDDRGRPERGFAKKRPWPNEARERGDASRGPRREIADRPPRERGGGRRDEIERVPRAAREGREWSERGERLRHSRRGPRDGDAG
jgi:hypothetical protein